MSGRGSLVAFAVALFVVAAADAQYDHTWRMSVHGYGTGAHELPIPLGIGNLGLWLVSLEQQTAAPATFTLVAHDGREETFSVSRNHPWEVRVGTGRAGTADSHAGGFPAGRTRVRNHDSNWSWTLVFTHRGVRPDEVAFLHNVEFSMAFSARQDVPNPVTPGFTGKVAAWPSSKGVLFWAFDPENPEALVKVLDGRDHNGHWWLDFAATSDLLTLTVVGPVAGRHDTDQYWVVWTGPTSLIPRFPGSGPGLVHCARPWRMKAVEPSTWCPVIGPGTSVSLRDAWDADGFIPDKYCRRRGVSYCQEGAAQAADVAAQAQQISRGDKALEP